ncbi:MAG: regulatory protein RecX [Gammaproteobacteria bacterium]|nr:regulatory protein RecX [Gammaproteobacteria bacterium]
MRRSRPRPEDPGDGRAVERAALDLLARREHSRAELARKLESKGFDAVAVAAALDDLAARDLVSDRRFTESYVRARAERGFGPMRVRAELRERGIDDALAAEYVDERAAQWAERLEAARRKRFGPDAPGDARERARQSRFLEQRGFTSEQIRRSLADDD